MLAGRLRRSREEILSRWEAGARTLPSAASKPVHALFNRLPDFLDWLGERLDAPEAAAEEARDAFGVHHAGERLAQGFDVVEAVAELALLRDTLLEIWEAEPEGVTPGEVRLLNAELDHVLAAVATEYVRDADAGAVSAAAGEGAGADAP